MTEAPRCPCGSGLPRTLLDLGAGRRPAWTCARCEATVKAGMRLCPCGSGKPSRWLRDARGIECGRVCDACEERQRARYRPEIFTDPAYEAEEPIEADDY